MLLSELNVFEELLHANVFGAVLLCLQVFFVQDWKFNHSNRQRGLKEGSGLKLVFV